MGRQRELLRLSILLMGRIVLGGFLFLVLFIHKPIL